MNVLQSKFSTITGKYKNLNKDAIKRNRCWEEISQYLLKEYPDDFAFHLLVYKELFSEDTIPLAWIPDHENYKKTNIYKWIDELNINDYNQLHAWSIENRKAFWEKIIKELNIIFHKNYDTILDEDKKSQESIYWLKGAKLNITDSIFQHNPDKTAIIHSSENDHDIYKKTYGDLHNFSSKVAAGLQKNGFLPGDRIVLYMPLTFESIGIYLGIIMAGMAVVSVADSFSASELKKRADISNAKAIFSCDGYYLNGKQLNTYEKIKNAEAPQSIIYCFLNEKNDLRDHDYWFENFVSNDKPDIHYDDPYHTTNILFSSGTTKDPKAIPWNQLTPIKSASDAYFHHDIHTNDIITWTTGMGWMMAPWLIYAGLLNGACLSIYHGSPASDNFGSFTEKAGTTILGTIPSLVKTWRKNGNMEKFNWKVRLYSSTGEPSNADDYLYLMFLTNYKSPVIEYCGGTEIGGGYITGSLAQPASPATFTTPAMGINFYLFNKNNEPVNEEEDGMVYIVPPSLGLSQHLLNRSHYEEYYENCPKGPHNEILRYHGDAFKKTCLEDLNICFYKSKGRIDDTMNLGGVKISAVEIESVLNKHPDIFETAAVGLSPQAGGPEDLYIFYVSKRERKYDELKKELQQYINKNLNPLFKIKEIIQHETLPRTATNKLMRRKLRETLN